MNQTLPQGKQLSKLLWAFSGLFILYGTTIPFSFHFSAAWLHDQLWRINWFPLVPSKQPIDISLPDYVQNILLFMPFGFLGWISVRHKRQLWKAGVLVLIGMLLSTFVETLQIASITRCPAVTDVIFNTLGTACGVITAMLTRRAVYSLAHHPHIRGLAKAESAFSAVILLGLVAVGELAPFDFSLDIGPIKDKVKALIADPFLLQLPSDDGIFFLRQGLLALFLSRLFKQLGIGPSILLSAVASTLYGLGLECSQMIVQSRGPSFQDGLVIVLGSGVGACLLPWTGFRRQPLATAAGLYLLVAASVALQELHPFQFEPWHGGANFLPFANEYANTSFLALAHFIEDMLAWLPLGFGFAYLGFGPALPILAALCTQTTFELAQGFVVGRHPDVTSVLSAVMGVMAGALLAYRGPKLFKEYLEIPTA